MWNTSETIAYYDKSADAFEEQTADLDMSAIQMRFLAHMPPSGTILDAGCGVGRDALFFAQRGYRMAAFDASAEMVARARRRLGGVADVQQMGFEDVNWVDAFDGIWACASLLHVATADLPGVSRRLVTALRPGGVWYLSFKYGEGERYSRGRRFTDQTEETLKQALSGLDVEVVDTWVSGDIRAGRSDEAWLNVVVRKVRR
jgi:SAM-dependent methyltransferase